MSTSLQGYTDGEENLAAALKGADVVIIPAGVPRKPGMTRDDLFKACWVERNLAATRTFQQSYTPSHHRSTRALCVI